MRNTDNSKVADTADRVASLLDAEGSSVDKSRLWRRAAQAIRNSPRALADVIEAEGIEGVHQLGIDYVVGGLLKDLLRTGRLTLLERLETRSACGTVLQRVPGIGPKLARELREVLGVDSLEGLARAAQDGALSSVCGFGPRRTRLIASVLASAAQKKASNDHPPEGQLDLWSATA